MRTSLLPHLAKMRRASLEPNEHETVDTLNLSLTKSKPEKKHCKCLRNSKGLFYMLLCVIFLDLARMLIKLAY